MHEDSNNEGGSFGIKKPSFATRGHPNDMQADPLQDEDIMKIDRLQLINASARYQLLSANQQLLDFHLSRIMQSKLKSKNQNIIKKKNQVLKESSEYN